MRANTLRQIPPLGSALRFAAVPRPADRRGATRPAAGRPVLPAGPAGRDRGHDRCAADRAGAADRRGVDARRHAAPRPRLVRVAMSAGHGAGLHAGAAQEALRGRSDAADCVSVKYVLLALILVAALLGNLTFLILDPITLIYRTTATALWPALVALISGVETVLYRLPFLRARSIGSRAAFRGVILPMEQPAYGMGVLLLLIFAGILALNAVRDRFWCRYLCPLGALLGLVSKVAWLRREVGDVCTECQRCARACPVGTIDPTRPASPAIRPNAPCAWTASRSAPRPARASPATSSLPRGRSTIHRGGSSSLQPARPWSPSGCSPPSRPPSATGPRLIRPPGAQGPEFAGAVHPLRHLPEGLPDVGPPAEPERRPAGRGCGRRCSSHGWATATTVATPAAAPAPPARSRR